MTERERLLEAILREPDADDVRLVYADWIEEHSTDDRELRRGEVIRLQHAKPELSNDQMAAVSNQRYAGLYGPDSRLVMGLFDSGFSYDMSDIVPGSVGMEIRLGFVSHLSVTRQQWLDHGEKAVKRWPIRRVVLNDLGPRVGRHEGRHEARVYGLYHPDRNDASDVPAAWLRLMRDFTHKARLWKAYPGPKAARLAAMAAALAWARKGAGII